MLELILLGSVISGYLIYSSITNVCKYHSNASSIPINDIIYVNNISMDDNTGSMDDNTIIVNNNPNTSIRNYNKISIITKEKNNDNELCSICLEEIKVNQTIRVLNCFHKYHKNCIDEWFNISLICPQCNYKFSL